MLGLTDQRRLVIGSLSGGQRKGASIATELVLQLTVCFLDEPSAGLDPIAAAALMNVLRLLADTGTTILMTTHNLADLRVADRLLVIAGHGKLVFDGARVKPTRTPDSPVPKETQRPRPSPVLRAATTA